MIVDAHQHYWHPARGDYGWLSPGSPLDRRWLPAHLAPELARAGVGGSVLVQAAPTLAETDWLLDLAAETPSVRGVVGWVDLDLPDAAEQAAALRPRGLVGVRPMLQDMADRDWILHPRREPALAALARHGLVFDALVRADGIDAIATLACRHPALLIVLDHAGKPPIGDGDAMAGWQAAMARLAARPNCRCKLSGLLTEAPPGTPPDTIVALVRQLVAQWGPDRLLWGSDWPVLTLAGGYGEWLDLAQRAAGLSGDAAQAVFGGNAVEVYGL